MRFFIRTCCFCIELHRGFLLTIRLEFVRLSWVLIDLLLHFFKNSSSGFSLYVEGVCLFAACLQAIAATRSYYSVFTKNDDTIHKKYVFFKIVFILANLTNMVYKFQFIYTKLPTSQPNNGDNGINSTFFFNFFLSWIDFYLLLIVYSFYYRLRKGYYGRIGEIPLFPDTNIVENALSGAIILEVEGYKVGIAEVKKSIPMLAISEKLNMKKSKQYFRIFPFPIIRRKDEVLSLSGRK